MRRQQISTASTLSKKKECLGIAQAFLFFRRYSPPPLTGEGPGVGVSAQEMALLLFEHWRFQLILHRAQPAVQPILRH